MDLPPAPVWLPAAGTRAPACGLASRAHVSCAGRGPTPVSLALPGGAYITAPVSTRRAGSRPASGYEKNVCLELLAMKSYSFMRKIWCESEKILVLRRTHWAWCHKYTETSSDETAFNPMPSLHQLTDILAQSSNSRKICQLSQLA